MPFFVESSKNDTMKHKILFVCHGNICRSPMAEFVMKHLVNTIFVNSRFQISTILSRK